LVGVRHAASSAGTSVIRFSGSGAQLNAGISASYAWDIFAKMTRRPSPRLIDNLRSTILRLENSPDVGPYDPAVITLKHMLVNRLADIQEDPAPGGRFTESN
jgi:hypothetical protein